MEFTLGIKPFTIMEVGKVIYGRLLLLDLTVSLKSQDDTGAGNQWESGKGNWIIKEKAEFSRINQNLQNPTGTHVDQLRLVSIPQCL